MLVVLGMAACTRVKPDAPSESGTVDTELPADTAPDDSALDTDTAPQDADGDGSPAGEDCDDSDPLVHPGAQEICNGEDDDCDGVIEGWEVCPPNPSGLFIARRRRRHDRELAELRR